MSQNWPESHAEKSSIVKELFISTADDNYALARWCFHNNLSVDFFWLAVHCLEKYLKAVLLMNGKSSKRYSHRIVSLYADVKKLAPELLPENLVKPPDMPSVYWREETTIDFIERLYRDGNADNRYLLFGYVRSPEDLFKLDQVVFSIRRLAQALEVRFVGEADDDGLPKCSRRQALALRPDRHENLQCNLEKIMSGARGAELQHALLNWNFPLVPNYKHETAGFVFSSRNPILLTRIYDPLEHGAEEFEKADRLWDWVKANIQLPDDLLKEMEAKREEIKRKNH